MALFFRKPKQLPRNLLVARTDRIGDLILTLPALETLGQHSIPFTVLCRETNRPLLENNPHPAGVITIGEDPLAAVAEIRDSAFDALLVMVNDPIINWMLPYLRHIPVRIGPLSKPFALREYTHPVLQKRSRSVRNEAEYNLELLEAFGIRRPQPVRPRLYFSTDEVRRYQTEHRPQLLGTKIRDPLIVMHPGMGGSALNWPPGHYGELLKLLIDEGWRVALTGFGTQEAGQNRQLCRPFPEVLGQRLFDLTQQLNLRELALLIAGSRLFIGPSTGPTHIANAVGTQLATFYPPIKVQSPRRWQPYRTDGIVFVPQVDCGRKYRCPGQKCRHYPCMDTIDPIMVMNQIQPLIETGRPPDGRALF